MRILLIIIFTLFQNSVYGSIKSKIINNFKLTNSLKFNFDQKIGKKIEKGECIIVYPKKIFCQYDDFYNKILVSNGKSLVINSDRHSQYYRYPLHKTWLNLILDKQYLIEEMKNFNNQSNFSDDYFFKFNNDITSIIIYFDKMTLNLKGWTTKDIYQNHVETKISNVKTNLYFNDKIFNIQNYIN
tara:strand:+ start:423 stop:977 length:555 start_codon:yes stop_codon:yes gene_type:complete